MNEKSLNNISYIYKTNNQLIDAIESGTISAFDTKYRYEIGGFMNQIVIVILKMKILSV